MAESSEKTPIEQNHYELNRDKSLKINGKIMNKEILSLDITREINSHSVLNLILYKSENEDVGDLEELNSLLEIVALGRTENNDFTEEKTVFTGIIDNVSFERDRIILRAKSTSYLLDKSKISRAYQNYNADEQAIYDEIKKVYAEINEETKLEIIYKTEDNKKEKNEKEEKGFFVQYEESCWEFVKRVASNTGLPLVNNDIFNSEEKKIDLLVGFKDMDENSKKGKIDSKNDKVSISKILNGKTSYKLSFNGILNPGDYINIDDLTDDFMVLKVLIKYNKVNSGQILNFEYFVSSKKIYKSKFIGNNKLAGRSLVGEVKEVGAEKDKTLGKVSVDFNFGDEIQKPGSAGNSFIWHATTYGGGDTGTCILPDIGDSVNIYFPNEKETDAYIRDSVRQVLDEKYHNVGMKSIIVGKDEKSVGILLSEEGGYFKIAGNNANTGKESSVYMKVKNGGITIKADNDNVMMIMSTDSILIKNKESQISVKDGLVSIASGSDSKIEIQDGKMILKSGSSSIDISDSGLNIKTTKFNVKS